jgi:hypothetical protein
MGQPVDEIGEEAISDVEDEIERLMRTIYYSNSGTVPPNIPRDAAIIKVTEMDTNSNSQIGCLESSFSSKLYNYRKHGTPSRIGEGDQYIEADKPQMSSNYHQCKAAREAATGYLHQD